MFSNATNFPATTIAPGDVYVIRPQASVAAAIVNASDGKTGNLYMTGNDPYALVKKDTGFSTANAKAGNNYTVMDVIGYPNANSDPYAVCGGSTPTNVTLQKKG